MIPELLKKYPLGSDLTIMNTYYQRTKYENKKKVSDDIMCLIYKDNQTGQKHYEIIKNPSYTYYKANDGVELDYSHLFIEKDKVHPITVPFTELEKSLAEQTENEEFYKYNKYRDRRELKKLNTDPRLFFSDVDIEDHYRFKFAMDYTNNITTLHKGFFDIEVEGKYTDKDFVHPYDDCPINCVSFHDEKSDQVFTFILRNSENPLIEKFEKEIESHQFGFDQVHEFVIGAVGGIKQAKKYNLLNTQFNFQFYDLEIELIKDLFKTIHQCSPDFIEGWNSSAFDLPFIIGRCSYLGYDPTEILCDQRWDTKIVNNYVDNRNINNLAERGDSTFISGLPVFIDQMIQYASRRKSKIGSYKSFKLDDIGEKEAKVKKLDYHHITHSVIQLPWLDFKTFVLYNIMDVIVQKCIEINTQDLEYIFSKCISNNTVYKKGHRQTVYLINRMAAEWYKMGYIIGNNVNRWNQKPPKYLGALVGNPLHTDSYSKLKIDGRPIWLCDNLQDYDYKSLYPSVMLEFNIAPNTQIGKIVIPEKVYEHENTYHIPELQYSRGGEFIENMVTDNEIEFCKRWYNLAGFQEILDDIDNYYEEKGFEKFSDLMKPEYGDSAILPISDSIETPLEFRYTKEETPIYFKNQREKKSYHEIIKGE